MQLVELGILAVGVACAVSLLVGKRKATPFLLAVFFLLLLVHLFASLLRWQWIPLYVAGFLLLGSLGLQRRWLRIGSGLLSLVAIFVTVAANWAFPLLQLPQPDGPHPVGTTTAEFVDTAREEFYSTVEGDPRRVMLRVWYPASSVEGAQPVKYFEHPLIRSRAVIGELPLPWFLFTHLGLVETHSFDQAPVAAGKFPLVLYSPGLGIGWSSSNTPLAEMLASHGYIVIGIDHTHLGSAAIFDDQVIGFDPETAKALRIQPPAEVMEIYKQVPGAREPGEQLALYMRAMEMMPNEIIGKVNTALNTQVADQSALLELVDGLATEVNVLSQIDENKMAVVGMSLGGSAAMLTCHQNARCDAAVNLDGFHPHQAELRANFPTMAIHRPDNLLVLENYSQAVADAYAVEIAGTTHFNYFDFTLMSPLYQRLGVLGEVDGALASDLIKRYTLGFLDEYLKGKTSDLLAEGEGQSGNGVTLLSKRHDLSKREVSGAESR